MPPIFYKGQKGEVYCLKFQKELLQILWLNLNSPVTKQCITYKPSSSPSSSSSSRKMIPYADLIILSFHHSPFPNADFLELSHHSHLTFPSQAFPPFSCPLPLCSNVQFQCRVQSKKLKSFFMPTPCHDSALRRQCQQSLGTGSLKASLINSSPAPALLQCHQCFHHCKSYLLKTTGKELAAAGNIILS